MKHEVRIFFKAVGLELLVYGVLTTGYFFLVLHLLGGWLLGLFQHDRKIYAAAALLLLVAQGALLDELTRLLLKLIKPGGEETK